MRRFLFSPRMNASANAGKRFERLADAAKALSQSLDLEDVGKRIVDSVLDLLAAHASALWILSPASGDLEIVATSGVRDRFFVRGMRLGRGEGLVGLAVDQRQFIFVPDVLSDPRVALPQTIRDEFAHLTFRSILALPILDGERVLGALSVRHQIGRVVSEEDIRVAQAFASHAAVAIKNAEQFAALERRRAEAENLSEIGRFLSQSLDPGETMQRVLSGIKELLGVRVCAVWLARATEIERVAYTDEVEFIFAGHTVFPAGVGVSGLAMSEGCTVVTGDLLTDPRIVLLPEVRDRIERASFRAVLAVPIKVRGQVIGALVAVDGKGRVFRGEDVRVAEAFAEQAAVALENARLYAEVRAGRDFLESITQNSADGIVATDFHGRLTYFSRGAEEIFGYSASEILGRPVADLLRGGLAEARETMSRLRAEDRVFNRETTCRAKDGRWVEISASFSLLRDSGGAAVGTVGVVRDVTERRRAEAEAERRRREAESLAAVGRLLSESLDPGEVAQRIADTLCVLLPVRASAIYRKEPDSEALELLTGAGVFGRGTAWIVAIPRGVSVAGVAVRERRPVATGDAVADAGVTLSPELRAIAEKSEFRAMLAVPLMIREVVIGAVVLRDRTGRLFSDAEVDLVRSFADQAAIALENARLYAETRQQTLEAQVLAKLARILNGSLDLDYIFRQVTEGAKGLCKSDIGAIAVRAPESETVVLGHWIGEEPGKVGMRFEPGKGVSGLVLETGRPFRTDDYVRDPRISKDYLAIALEEGVITVAAVPIKFENRVQGCIVVANRSPRPFSQRDEEVLSELADHAAIALKNVERFLKECKARALAEATSVRLEGLSRRLVEVQEVERRSLARELHDEIGQLLTGLKLTLDTIGRLPAKEARAQIDDGLAQLDELIRRTRELSLDLRPSMLDDLGLFHALVWHFERYKRRTGVRVTFGHSGVDRRFPAEVETAAYRIVQEALTNVARHAGVREANVRVWATPEMLGVQVEDRGKGFDPDVALATQASSGLSGMVERARSLGGLLTIDSAPGKGTWLTAELPLLAQRGSTWA